MPPVGVSRLFAFLPLPAAKHDEYFHTFLVLLLILLLLMMGGMLLYFFRYRKAERQRLAAMERNKGIFEFLPLRLGALDLDGRYLYLQAAGSQVSGTERAGPDLTLYELFEPDFANYLVAINRIVYHSGVPLEMVYPFEGRLRRALHRPLPPEVFGVPATMFVSVDVTELQVLQDRNAALTERLRTTLDAINEAVLTVDGDSVVTLLNRRAAEVLGCSAEEALGRKLQNYFDPREPENGAPLFNPFRDLPPDVRPEEVVRRIELLGDRGEVRRFEERCIPCWGADGVRQSAVMVLRDITEEERRNDEILLFNEMLSRTLEHSGLACFLTDEYRKIFPDFRSGDFWRFDENGEPMLPEEVVHPEDLAAFTEANRRFWGGGASEIEEVFRVILPDRVRKVRLKMIRNKFSRNGKLYHFGMMQDVFAAAAGAAAGDGVDS